MARAIAHAVRLERPWRLDGQAQRACEMHGRPRGRVIERSERAARRADQEADELRSPVARSRRLDARELALDLAGQEHRDGQEAVAA